MKNILKLSLLSLFLMSSLACEKVFMKPNAGTDNLSVFNEYAKICIEKFGLEEVKNINLEALADSIRPYINESLTEQQLFDYMAIITLRMKEGHTRLSDFDNEKSASYAFFLGYPSAYNFLIVNKYYYGEEANPNVQTLTSPESFFEIKYGFLPQDPEIGYIRIVSFDMDLSKEQLEPMMEYLKDAKGIIIDVRGNLGGFLQLGNDLASFFTTTEVVVGQNRIKNGPGKNDFATSIMSVKPSGSPNTFTKPVAVLHDRISFSTGTMFPIMMSAMNNVVTIGQIFGGGSGDIMDGYLTNGWHYIISTSNLINNDGNPTDNGIEPDIPVLLNPQDTANDAIIDRAILELK